MNVIKPEHYRGGEVDLIDGWALNYSVEEFRAIMKSHIHKYIYRYEKKGGLEDLQKAKYYIERLEQFEMDKGTNGTKS